MATKHDKAVGESVDEQVQAANERADQAQAELAQLKQQLANPLNSNKREAALHDDAEKDEEETAEKTIANGEAELRKDSMMAHLLDSLEAGKDIGHYGRLVFAMVARHFMPHEEVLGWLARDPDFESGEAEVLLRQVEERNYNPPRRERIIEWHGQQEFPILPKPDDPDCGNLYRNLTFPEGIYENIEHYQEKKMAAE